jgi:poly(hydroxyalkanoate) granule-associated protein
MGYFNEMDAVVRQLPQEAVARGRKVWLAGVGAAHVMSHTTGTLFDSLVDEGRRVQQAEGERVEALVSQARQRVTTGVNEAVDYVQGNAEQATRTALARLGIPTRREIADLSTRIAALTARIEGLSRNGAGDVQ